MKTDSIDQVTVGYRFIINDDLTVEPSSNSNLSGTHRASLDYYNYTNTPLRITYRDGTHFVLAPYNPENKLQHNNKLIIRKKMSYVDKYVNVNYGNPNIHHRFRQSSEDRAIEEAMKSRSSPCFVDLHHMYNTSYFSVDYLVDASELRNAGGYIYLSQLDVLVSFASTEIINHPYSTHGHAEAFVHDKLIGQTEGKLTFQFKISDPNKKFGRRYVNFNGEIFEIPISHDDSLKEGVWVNGTSPSMKLNPEFSVCYSFEEADEVLDIYTSVDEAKRLGRDLNKGELQYQKETNEYNKKVLEFNKEILELKQQSANSQLELERQKHTHERELLIEKAKLQKEKDDLERKMFARKDMSDITKTAMVLLSTSLNIYLLYLKLKSTT